MARLLLCLCLVLSLAVPLVAQERHRRLKIGLVGTPPFVLYENHKPTGIAVELWEEMAARLKLQYDYHHVENQHRGLEDLSHNKLDVLIGTLSITAERERVVDFTQPYYQSTVAILSPVKGSPWDRLRPVVRTAAIYGLAGIFLALLLVGTLLWLLERGTNKQFPDSPGRGIANGFWLALVTMSTVGYGDRVPVTPAGRLVTSVWILISMLIVGSIVAGISSSLTLSQIDANPIEKPGQLEDLRVATVQGSFFEGVVGRYTDRVVLRPGLDAAVATVMEGKADCVVFDRPSLSYFLAKFPELPLHLSSFPFETQNYGFGLRPNFELTNDLNIVLLAIIESGRLKQIESRWQSSLDEE